MCCLNYEQSTYEEIRRRLPRISSIVNTQKGRGEVISNSVVNEKVKVKIKIKDGDEIIEEFKISEITLVSGGYEGTVNDEELKIEVYDDTDEKVIKQLLKDN
jgi:cell fate regulator YaaT (PSP1 superfamily)